VSDAALRSSPCLRKSQVERVKSRASSDDCASSRLAVIGWATDDLSPRGQRTKHVLHALQRHGTVQWLRPRRGPASSRSASGMSRNSVSHRLGRLLVRHIMLDKFEPSAARHLWRWRPIADAAVLIGSPFSPLAYATRRLAHFDIPYAVDVGDPWSLTYAKRTSGLFKHWRACRAERRVWRNARAAIVTTSAQAAALAQLFPHLAILVRPNGYDTVTPVAGSTRERRSRERYRELRLAHYGALYAPRLDPEPFFESLAASGLWHRILLRQHGSDWDGMLDRIARHIDIELRSPIPWQEVVSQAPAFDAALVIGNTSPAQLPSKAIQYLTLPVPRIAIVSNDPTDSLACYLADKSGWAVISSAAPDPARSVATLVSTSQDSDLIPPTADSWPAVEAVLSDFILSTTGLAPSQTQARGPGHPLTNESRC